MSNSFNFIELIALLNQELKNLFTDVMHNKNRELFKTENLNKENFNNMTVNCLNCLQTFTCNKQGYYQQLLALFKIFYPFMMYFGFVGGLMDINDNESITIKMRHSLLEIIENIGKLLENTQENDIFIKKIEDSFKETRETVLIVIDDFSTNKIAVSISDMTVTVQEAISKMNEILTKSEDSAKNNLDDKVTFTCTDLMNEISSLILKSEVLQAEITSQGMQANNSKDLYMQNQLWSDGFISAAKSIATSATFFV